MKVTAVTSIFPGRNNQSLNRDDSENTANRKPPKNEKGKKDKKDINKTFSRKPDELIFSSFAQGRVNRRLLEFEDNIDDWTGL